MIQQADKLMSQLNEYNRARFNDIGVNDVTSKPDTTVDRVIVWNKSKNNVNLKQVQSLERKPSSSSNEPINTLPLPSVKLDQRIISTLVDLLRVNVNIFFNEMIHAAYKDRSNGVHGTRIPSTIADQIVDNASVDVKKTNQKEKRQITIDRVIRVTSALQTGKINEPIDRNSVNDESDTNNTSYMTNSMTGVDSNSISQSASETIGIGKGDIPQSLGKPSGLEPPRFDKPNQMIHNSIALVTATASIGSNQHHK